MSDPIERFRRLAEGRSKMRGQDDVIYEIHVGEPGHAWIASSDLIAAADEIEALRAEVERLAETGIDLAAHLAAAISLLERGGKAAKKAAPSDKMFDQMIRDYKRSLNKARAALTRTKDTTDDA